MAQWHAPFDSIYNRPPKSIGDAVVGYISDMSNRESGKLEEIESTQDRILEVLAAILTATLTPQQEAAIAEKLGLIRASRSE